MDPNQSWPPPPPPPPPPVSQGWPPPVAPWQPPQSGPDWGPPPVWVRPPERRGPRTWAVIAAIAGVVVVLASIVTVTVGSNDTSDSAGTFRSSAPTTPAPDYPSLIAPAGPGFLALSDFSPGSGPLTADKLAETTSNPTAERNGLKASGFVDGYQRNFTNRPDTAGYYIRIYRLGDENGAQYWLNLDVRGTGKLGPVTQDPARHMSLIVMTDKDKSGKWSAVVLAAQGNYAVAVRQWSSSDIESLAPLEDIVAQQLARLPAS